MNDGESGRSAGHPDAADRPDEADPEPPPRRGERLPLPRRAQQTHLEPQLREPGGSGSGTPFEAFTADEPESEAAATVAEPPDGRRAAAFHESTRRDRRVGGC